MLLERMFFGMVRQLEWYLRNRSGRKKKVRAFRQCGLMFFSLVREKKRTILGRLLSLAEPRSLILGGFLYPFFGFNGQGP